ncbi:MAG: ATP-binding cassette domain-containing protein [Bradyrhizobium sp.]|uniref:ABC transporter ATP-binding protein n=1 Tax=Propionimicrobium lymphophilum ACS-093-V-SCH5 TaxID=883161 RepID=S2VYA7_9ACTN|nr:MULTISPECIES: ATP-binding cassette domain-containing protein [Bacteria]EPD32518.1 cobalt ABC transporter, ATP-binding protein [Propionimicrobium lymphophilum ACS-093-V-SCH5]MDK7710497.1 ATP-binding cassette domain-containing protein [Propionimicrobium lymphophilum]MDK7734481.1 ATP-binding cassette domain-containing protein [Propionimicrobium lymphophilum]MDU6804102.1 ATP-binding cassette domain-containing protein [Bradyrhizobium sp.]
MLSAENLIASYLNGRRVLDEANVHFESGCRVALLGANGCGKTTLMRCLTGAHKPDSGAVKLDGQVLKYGKNALRDHRRKVQMVLQDPDDQLFSADVTQDIAFGPLNLGLSEDEALARVNEVVEELGIEHLAKRPTHQLSYGERKRVTIAGAVAMRPDVLLLDEPTAGLDRVGIEQIRDLLSRLHALGTSIVLATHEVDFALAWADEAAIVCEGKIHQGPIVDMLSDHELLNRAHLLQPWQLQLSRRLELGSRPVDMDEMVAALEAWRRS